MVAYKKSWIIICLVIVLCLMELSDSQRGNARRRRPNRRRQNRRRTTPLPATDTSVPRNRNQAGGCQKIVVPMCRGLVNYRRAYLPNQFGHTNQTEVYSELEYLWPFMDIGCSRNFRVLACGMYLPRCPGRSGVQGGMKPCRETCQRALRCNSTMTRLQSSWPNKFVCDDLLPRKSKKCIPPVSERPRCGNQHVMCQRNRHKFCEGLNFPMGSLPNMFLQCTRRDIHKEMDEYRQLVDSNCSPHLKFLLCGIYQPFCTRAENPFALPCRELCEQVREDCQAAHAALYGGLSWPGKLQCHRYPLSTDSDRLCVMPSDTSMAMLPDDESEN